MHKRITAVHGGGSKAPPSKGPLYTEDDFNATSTLENGEAYWLSKVQAVAHTHALHVHAQTKAEQAAWAIAKEHGLDVVTILPNFVLGPVINDRIDGLSALFVKVLQVDDM